MLLNLPKLDVLRISCEENSVLEVDLVVRRVFNRILYSKHMVLIDLNNVKAVRVLITFRRFERQSSALRRAPDLHWVLKGLFKESFTSLLPDLKQVPSFIECLQNLTFDLQ